MLPLSAADIALLRHPGGTCARLLPLVRRLASVFRLQLVGRRQRVLLALGVVWAVAVCDYRLTLWQRDSSDFVELNPVAARLIGAPAAALATYKFGLLGVGTTILLSLRQHRSAEYGCWLLCAAKAALALQWYLYFNCLAAGGGALGAEFASLNGPG